MERHEYNFTEQRSPNSGGMPPGALPVDFAEGWADMIDISSSSGKRCGARRAFCLRPTSMQWPALAEWRILSGSTCQ